MVEFVDMVKAMILRIYEKKRLKINGTQSTIFQKSEFPLLHTG